MAVIFEAGYTPGVSDEPATHAKIAHAGNWFAGGTISASTTDADYFETAPDTSQTFQKWKPAAMPASWETDLGAAQDVDYCCIAAHSMGTDATTLTVEYWDGAAWQAVIPATLIDDNSHIMCIFTSVNAQRWRVYLTGAAEPDIGVIRFGAALQMPRPIYGGHAPIDFNRNTTMQANRSETGEFLGRSVLRTSLATAFAWRHITAQWVRDNWGDTQINFERDAFFAAWRPETWGEVGYCQTSEASTPSNMGIRDLMEVTLTVEGLSYD